MNAPEQPKISVVMPAYNAEKYIREAIDSILAQTFTNFEFIIIDDGSVDQTVEIIRSYTDPRIRFYQNEQNLGVAATLNRGLDLARGEYIARMDADDISLPERFEKQIAYMERHPDVGVCGSNILIFGDGQERLYTYAASDGQIRADMMFNSAFAHPSVMMRKCVLDREALRYDCTQEKAEDYGLWANILQHADGSNIQQPLLRYRHHSSQVTKTHQSTQRTAANLVRERILAYRQVSLTTAERTCYFEICNGVRSLSDSDYRLFFSGGKKIISSFQHGRSQIRKLYAQLNLAVISSSDLERFSFFSWREPLWLLLHRVKGVFR